MKHEPGTGAASSRVSTPGVLRQWRALPETWYWALVLAVFQTATTPGDAAVTQERYYGHAAVQDRYGVIRPWYRGLNGPCDLRVRIAAETLKRYPWTTTSNAIAALPAYIFSGHWQIASNGVITPQPCKDWDNGDLGQRATSALEGFVAYYRYSGDAAAIAHLTYMANFLVDHCLTPPDHPWPGMFISVPVKGTAYGKCDPAGMIQLDICASTGEGLLRAYEVTGNARWLETARHWGDLLAEHCNLDPQSDPWPRYANPEAAPWKDNKQTGSVCKILSFLDELARLGYTGKENRIGAAREAGRRYLQDRMLPLWAVNDTWGRYFWDWINAVQTCQISPDASRYLLDNAGEFPNWRADARNIVTLFLNRSSVSPASRGDVYAGAWAFPEANQCCERSLWYAPLCVAPALAQYAVQAEDDWMRELAYRMTVLATYDIHETGVTEDKIDGGIVVNGSWLNIAHPLPLRWVLTLLGWLPEELGANRENHIMRSSAVVNHVRYAKGQVEYSTFDAPRSTVDVLRLAFAPSLVIAGGQPLAQRSVLDQNGWVLKKLRNGDCIVTIRHDGATEVSLSGKDVERIVPRTKILLQGEWKTVNGAFETASNAALSAQFRGNRVIVIGRVGPDGGLADVYLDGQKQLAWVDSWNPAVRESQVLYYCNGLASGPHTLNLVARGAGNPCSQGATVAFREIRYSAATGNASYPAGTGPHAAQRMVFGYAGRDDIVDEKGETWRPATELVTQIGAGKDSVAECWWTTPAPGTIAGTADPELYRYGVHGTNFWVNLTVGPGRYHVRLKFAATRGIDASTNCFDVLINGHCVAKRLDVAAAGGGPDRALDLVFNDITPKNGIIEVRFTGAALPGAAGTEQGQAFVQALEVGPGRGGIAGTSNGTAVYSKPR